MLFLRNNLSQSRKRILNDCVIKVAKILRLEKVELLNKFSAFAIKE